MADNIENGGEAAKPSEGAEAKSDAKSENKKTIKNELPKVDAPPLSPAGEVEPAVEPSTDLILAAEPDEQSSAKAAPWRLRLRARHRRQAVMAASVLFAAAIGAVIGARALAPSPAPPDTAALREREAMQQSIASLNKEVAALKSDLDAGTKSARSQIAKITERLRSAPETTGSIPAPPAAVPTPTPRPAQQADIRMTVVHDWSIYDVHNGIIAVRGHGDIYEIGLGAPLPGLGPVEQIKRVDGRWVVVTPKGIIVSMRDRGYFESN